MAKKIFSQICYSLKLPNFRHYFFKSLFSLPETAADERMPRITPAAHPMFIDNMSSGWRPDSTAWLFIIINNFLLDQKF